MGLRRYSELQQRLPRRRNFADFGRVNQLLTPPALLSAQNLRESNAGSTKTRILEEHLASK